MTGSNPSGSSSSRNSSVSQPRASVNRFSGRTITPGIFVRISLVGMVLNQAARAGGLCISARRFYAVALKPSVLLPIPGGGDDVGQVLELRLPAQLRLRPGGAGDQAGRIARTA